MNEQFETGFVKSAGKGKAVAKGLAKALGLGALGAGAFTMGAHGGAGGVMSAYDELLKGKSPEQVKSEMGLLHSAARQAVTKTKGAKDKWDKLRGK